jgi:hypothetical protein
MRIKVKAAMIALAGVSGCRRTLRASSWPTSVVGTWDMLADQR